MHIHHGIASLPHIPQAVVTSGTFDGVHLGHQQIIRRLCELAKQRQGETVLITFYPHPRLVLGQHVELLSTLEEKAFWLRQYGIQHLLVLPFTQEFSQMSPEEFVQKVYIEAVQTRTLVIGYDHHFGKNRQGNFQFLKENQAHYPFDIEEIPRHDIEKAAVSSTKIREALQQGDIAAAQQLLGRAYELNGQVVHGDKIGRTLGYPTANVHIKEHYKLVPADGIYAAQVLLGQQSYQGMLYIGNRPSVDGAAERKIEVNIFDFSEEIYGQNIRLQLIEKIRGDAKFDSLEALSRQLAQDKIRALQVLNNP
jgi:riboflavin kinase/FMN adenylyltransferase